MCCHKMSETAKSALVITGSVIAFVGIVRTVKFVRRKMAEKKAKKELDNKEEEKKPLFESKNGEN